MTSGSGSGQRHVSAYCQKECCCLKEAKFACLCYSRTWWLQSPSEPMAPTSQCKYQPAIAKLRDMTMTLCQANHTFSAQCFHFEKKQSWGINRLLTTIKQWSDRYMYKSWTSEQPKHITQVLFTYSIWLSTWHCSFLFLSTTSVLKVNKCYCYSGPPLQCQTSQVGDINNQHKQNCIKEKSSPICLMRSVWRANLIASMSFLPALQFPY